MPNPMSRNLALRIAFQVDHFESFVSVPSRPQLRDRDNINKLHSTTLLIEPMKSVSADSRLYAAIWLSENVAGRH